jgi:amino-acid N-acetyltransferase
MLMIWRGRSESEVSYYQWSEILIRKAVIQDIKAIHRLLGIYAGQNLLLPRSLSELYEHMRDLVVLVREDGAGPSPLIGVCALGICWEDLAEIRSLAVAPDQKGQGYGTLLVEACLEDARSLGVKTCFALTYVPEFFLRLGFHEVEKSVLPHKVWSDCLKCPNFPDCDEKAMMVAL